MLDGVISARVLFFLSPQSGGMLALVSVTLAFALQPGLQPHTVAQTNVRMSAVFESRRAALLAGAATAFAVSPVFADDAEDIVARIAAKNALALEKERAAANSIDAKTAEEQSAEGKGLVGTFLLGSVVLSVPFYYKNIQRLFIKVSSGGKESGYDKVK